MTPMFRAISTALGAALLFVLLPALAEAQQQPGRARIQGRDNSQPEAPVLGPASSLTDPKQEMRDLVKRISKFARRYNRNFTITVRNGVDLLTKGDVIDDSITAPALAYIKSIDGILIDGLNFGIPEIDKPTLPKERREKLLKMANLAKANGLTVMVMDYATTPKTVDDTYRLNASRGFISYIAPVRGYQLNMLPPYPKRPFRENPKSVMSSAYIKNFVYLADTSTFGRQDEFALKIHQTNYDAVVVDVFHGREPLTKRAVETLKYKKVGGKRLVLAFMNISSAESYRYYWQSHWQEGSPLWISAPYRNNPDKYHVEYWRPEWQRIISGNTESYLYGIIAQGFDGVILDGVQGYRFFEGGGETADLEE